MSGTTLSRAFFSMMLLACAFATSASPALATGLVIAPADISGEVGYMASFTITPPTGVTIDYYYWDMDGDGYVDYESAAAAADWTYTTAGTFTVQVDGYDAAGTLYTGYANVTISDTGTTGTTTSTTPGGALVIAPADQSIATGGTASFTLTPPAGVTITYYYWDMDGDGTSDYESAAAAAEWTYTTAGAYAVQVDGYDDAGTLYQGFAAVIVGDNSGATGTSVPTGTGLVIAPADIQAEVGYSASFTVTTPTGVTITSYDWDLDGDGYIDYESATGAAEWNYTTAGTFVVQVDGYDAAGTLYQGFASVIITDGTGTGSTSELSLTTTGSTQGDAPFAVSFTALNGDGLGITEYEWDFDGDWIADKVTASASADFTYSTPGTYIASVAGEASDGYWYYAEVTITVLGEDGTTGAGDIILTAWGDAEAGAPQVVTFTLDGAGVSSLLYYYWDFDGDDYLDDVTTDPFAEYEYLQGGTYTVSVVAEDTFGELYIATVSFTLAAQQAPEDAQLLWSPTSGSAPLLVDFTVTQGDAFEEFWWDFDGDGQIDWVTDEAEVSWVYGTPGHYTPALYLVDWSGGEYGVTAGVDVEESANAPVISSGSLSSSQIEAPGTVTLQCSASSPTGDTLYYLWDFEGDGYFDWETTTNSLEVEYYEAGTYYPFVAVMDDVGHYVEKELGTLKVTAPSQAKAAIMLPEKGEELTGLITVVAVVSPPGANLSGKVEISADGSTWQAANSLSGWEDWMVLSEEEPGWYIGFLDASSLSDGTYSLRTSISASGRTITSAAVSIVISSTGADWWSWYDDTYGETVVQTDLDEEKRNQVAVGGDAFIEIPRDGFSGSGNLQATISKPSTDSAARGDDGRTRLREGAGVVGLSLSAAGGALELTNRATVKLRYDDADNNGKVDGTDVDETALKVYAYDSTAQSWRQVTGSTVDANANQVSFRASQLGDFVLSSTTPTEPPLGTQSTGTSTTGTPKVQLRTDKSTFTGADTLALRFSCTAGSTSNQGDLYIAVFLPDGSFVCLQGLSMFHSPNQLSPVLSSWTMSSLAETALFNVPASLLPAGTYNAYAVFAQPGSSVTASTNWIASHSASFTVSQ